MVGVLLGSSNRDETKFEEPDRFNILREKSHTLSFGYGIHFCVGAPLARMEADIALRAILKRWESIELIDSPREYAHAMHMRTMNALPLRVR